MLTLAWLVGLLAILSFVSYHRAALWLASVTLGVYLIAWFKVTPPPIAVMILVWLPLIALGILINIRPLRRRFISARVLERGRRERAPFGDAELNALDDMPSGWERTLFSGRPNWKGLTAQSVPALTADEIQFLEGPTRELCRHVDQWERQGAGATLDDATWSVLKQHGFLTLGLPAAWGGPQLSPAAQSRVILQVTARSPSAGAVLAAASALGVDRLLLHHGSDNQRQAYLPTLAQGAAVATLTIGSPAGPEGQRRNVALICRDTFNGEETLGLRLRWDTRLVPFAPLADWLLVGVSVHDPDQLLGDTPEPGMTLVMVSARLPGVTIGSRHRVYGNAFPSGPTRGDDVFVPLSQVLGEASGVGQGWRQLMEALPSGQIVALAAANLAIAKRAAQVAGASARLTPAAPATRHRHPEQLLARIAGTAYTLEAIARITTSSLTDRQTVTVADTLVRHQLQPLARQALLDAAALWPGAAFFEGPSNPLSPGYLSVTTTATLDIGDVFSSSMLTYGHGGLRYHPYLSKELRARNEGAANLVAFDHALFGHLGYCASNLTRACFLGLTRARFTRSIGDPQTRRYFRQVSRMAAAFAAIADAAAVTAGFNPSRRQPLSARLDTIAARLYAAAAGLKYHADEGYPRHYRAVVDWTQRTLLYEVQEALLQTIGNIRGRWRRRLLRRLTFPFGRAYALPLDYRVTRVSRLLTSPSVGREHLLAGLDIGPDQSDSLATLERAFEAVANATESERKLTAALDDGRLRVRPGADPVEAALATGLLELEEAYDLERAFTARRAVKSVDDFPQDQPADSAPAARAQESI